MTISKTFIVYCDGSVHPNPNGTGGWGAIVIDPEGTLAEYSGGEKETTNNRMELTAALEGLKKIPDCAEVNLYSDSQYVCNGFAKKWVYRWMMSGWQTSTKTPVANKDLWEQLLIQSKRITITWNWVRGHADDVHNNRCDELANEARKNLIVG